MFIASKDKDPEPDEGRPRVASVYLFNIDVILVDRRAGGWRLGSEWRGDDWWDKRVTGDEHIPFCATLLKDAPFLFRHYWFIIFASNWKFSPASATNRICSKSELLRGNVGAWWLHKFADKFNNNAGVLSQWIHKLKRHSWEVHIEFFFQLPFEIKFLKFRILNSQIESI